MAQVPMYTPVRDYRKHHWEYQQAINEVLESGMFINGPQVAQLEADLAKFVGVPHCVAVASGTDALLVALMALDVKPGDEVITSAHTWISSGEVISLLGAKPVWVDIDPKTFLIDLDKIEEKITPRTVGIMPISLYGNMVDVKKMTSLAKKHGLWVIEDGAQSFGTEREGYLSSSWSLIGCTSFFPSKPMGGYGDSGACFTKHEELALKMRAIKNHGGLVRMKHDHIGLNARMDTLQAAILQVKLKHFPEVLEKRRAAASYYENALARVPGLEVAGASPMTKSSWAQFSLMMKGDYRDQVEQMLKERGVACSVFYKKGLHQHKCFEYLGPADLPNTEYVCNRILHIPLFAELTEEELRLVAKTITEVMNEVCSNYPMDCDS